MTKQPIARQTREVALLERINSQSVMAVNTTFTMIIRLERRSLRSLQRVTVSQKKKIPLIRHATPSMFLLVVAPTNVATPVHWSYCLPISGKYLYIKIESGINK